MDIALVVLAAGLGTRFGGDKAFAPIGPSGEALFDYAAYDAARAGATRIVFVIRKDQERALLSHVEPTIGAALPVHLAFQVPPSVRDRIKPWGTGDALLTAAAHVQDACVVVNGDDYYGADDIRQLITHLTATRPGVPPDHAMVGYRLADTPMSDSGGVSRAVCRVDREGYLEAIDEIRQIVQAGDTFNGIGPGGASLTLHPSAYASMNLWGFHASILEFLGAAFNRFRSSHSDDPTAEFFIGAGVQEEIHANRARVRVLPAKEPGLGITWARDVDAVRAAIDSHVRSGRYPAALEDGFRALRTA